MANVEQSGSMMVGVPQQRAVGESSEWRVGLNKDIRYRLVWILPLLPDTIVTSLGRVDIVALIRFSYLASSSCNVEGFNCKIKYSYF